MEHALSGSYSSEISSSNVIQQRFHRLSEEPAGPSDGTLRRVRDVSAFSSNSAISIHLHRQKVSVDQALGSNSSVGRASGVSASGGMNERSHSVADVNPNGPLPASGYSFTNESESRSSVVRATKSKRLGRHTASVEGIVGWMGRNSVTIPTETGSSVSTGNGMIGMGNPSITSNSASVNLVNPANAIGSANPISFINPISSINPVSSPLTGSALSNTPLSASSHLGGSILMGLASSSPAGGGINHNAWNFSNMQELSIKKKASIKVPLTISRADSSPSPTRRITISANEAGEIHIEKSHSTPADSVVSGGLGSNDPRILAQQTTSESLASIQASGSRPHPIRQAVELPKETLDLIQSHIDHVLNVREMCMRLRDTRINSDDPYLQVLRHTKIDISKPLTTYEKVRAKIKANPRGLMRLWIMLKRVLDGEHYKIPRVIEDSSSPTSADSPLALSLHTPPHGTHPPPGVDLDDYLQLAIYYHEQAELDISIYYLELSIQKDKNPLAFFLLGICLRHGWGREPSRHRGFQCLINSAEYLILSIPSIIRAQKLIERQNTERMERDRKERELLDRINEKQIPGNPKNKQRWSTGVPLPEELEPTKSVSSVSPSLLASAEITHVPTSAVESRRNSLIRRLTYGQKAKAESHASKPSISGVSAQLTTPQMASPMTSNQSIPTNSHIGSPMGSISAFKSAASLSVFKSVASLMSVATRRSINSTTSFHTTLPLPPDIEVVKAILPLPLYEIGICLSHGWGTPVSKSAAAYYFRAAAAFGDRDAELEYGYCLLRGMGVPRDKLEAAKFLRLAEQKGCSLTGESWIHKPKWGGAG